MSAQSFDVRGFMFALGEAVRPFAGRAGAQASTIVGRVRVLEADTEATLQAIATEQNPERRAALQHDLEAILPARRDFVLSAAESMAGTTGYAAFEAALDVAVKLAIAVGRSLLPIP